ncbi:amphi-Trp domain-containing protein [uncultured Tateyamaria sp.]|uniref:amphi-Trp domain-containing protein n=1 Tax=uncultured Tateyamaria sp. TaxID=455651 RepID=UPI00262524EC|nr:amphi-Trp domain-containing protein [uncultured Tateyamaria sp.]
MGREITLFSSKEAKSRGEIATFLRGLADRFDAAEVILRKGQDEIVLSLPDRMMLELKVEDEEKRNKGIQHSLEVEMKWYDGDTPTGPVELG